MDPVFRPNTLFSKCAGCLHEKSCDRPVDPCPPLRTFMGKPDTRMLSPINPDLPKWLASIGGKIELDFPFPSAGTPSLPPVLPAIARRLEGRPARLPLVGITLSRVLRSDGTLRFSSRQAFLHKFGLSLDTQLVLVCIDTDVPLEHFWQCSVTSEAVVDRLAAFGFYAVLAPNYSVFLRRSPLEHSINCKRSLLTAAQLAAAGIPTIPHVYAAGERAQERIVAWLRKNPQITTICRELQTAKSERVFHDTLMTMRRIVQEVERPLHVVFVGPGSMRRLSVLMEHFPRASFVSAKASMCAGARRAFILAAGRLEAVHHETLVPTRTFERNVRILEHAVEQLHHRLAQGKPGRPGSGAQSATGSVVVKQTSA